MQTRFSSLSPLHLSKQLLFLTLAASLMVGACGDDEGFDDLVDVGSKEELREVLTDIADDEQIPALSALVFTDDEIKTEALIGVADLETEEALTANHAYLLASVSKLVTGTALLRLLDAGRLELDDPINDYLPFRVQPPNTTTPITFRMLLTHTSGIDDGPALDDEYHFETDSPKALRTFLEAYLVPGGADYDATANFHDFEPGTQHAYSNTGSALVGLLVETIAGEPFDAYCQRELFDRLDMRHTHWRLADVDGPLVSLYDLDGDSPTKVRQYTFTDYPNGGLRSTARDLQELLTSLSRAYSGATGEVLTPSTTRAMFSPQIPSLDAEVGLHAFLVSPRVWGHDGGESGASTLMGVNPETGRGAVVLANQGDAEVETIFAQVLAY